MGPLPKLLMIAGSTLLIVGIVLHFGGKFLPLGKLPGDIAIEKENVKIYFPFATSIFLSVALSLIVWIVRWFSQK